jgi:hypothetical protein
MTVTLPRRIAEIRDAIEARLDFTGLANGGETALFEWAKRHGLRGPSLVLEWQRNYNRAHGEGARPAAAKSARPARVERYWLSDDLDHWASDDDVEPDDVDDGDDDSMMCPKCLGVGCVEGERCSQCGGSGRVPIPGDDDDEENDDDEF